VDAVFFTYLSFFFIPFHSKYLGAAIVFGVALKQQITN